VSTNSAVDITRSDPLAADVELLKEEVLPALAGVGTSRSG